MKENEMGVAGSMDGEVKCIQGFHGKARRKETTGKFLT
jgi:hypothetical protein